MHSAKHEMVTVVIELVRETDKYVIARHDEREMWFDKQKVAFHVEEGQVHVTLEKNLWQKRMARQPDEYRMAEAPVETWLKKCLMCGVTQQLEKPMRVCDCCKATELWRCS